MFLCVFMFGCLISVSKAAEGDVIASDDFGVKDLQSWRLEGVGWANEGIEKEGKRIKARDTGNRDDAKKHWYFAAPKEFLGGDTSHAYNGWLVYTLGHFEYEDMGEGVITSVYDVILISTRKKFSLGLKGVFVAQDDHLSATYQVRLEETFSPNNGSSYWELATGKSAGKRASKHELVQCLANMAQVRIRGSYFKGIEATWLSSVVVLEGLADKGGRFPSMTESTQNDGGPEFTVVNGIKVYGPRSAAPTPSSACCSNRHCVGRDRFELVFERPGCMHTSDTVCDEIYKSSQAATIIEGSDLNEGRVFLTPERPTPCRTLETSEQSASPLCNDGLWAAGTKNQNIGALSVPIRKPFSQDYYFNSVPVVCGPATLTVTVHGDLEYSGDSILVYGEDGAYLGAVFEGNLSYVTEGQRPYPVNTDSPHTKCSARVAAVRGGVTPDASGNTNCADWSPGDAQQSSSQVPHQIGTHART